MKRFLITLVFLIILLSAAFPLFVLAQNAEYEPLVALPGTGEGGTIGNKVTLATYLPGIFNLTIAVAGALAVIVMVIGGVQYLSTDAISGREAGKERMTNALVGLLLALASWVILYTLNPKILVFDLNLQRIAAPGAETPPPEPEFLLGEDETAICLGPTQGTMVSCTCEKCAEIGSGGQPPYDKIPLKSGSNKKVASFFAVRLKNLTEDLAGTGLNWQVTEAWRPTVNHKNDCHRNGKCVDANITNPSVTNIKTFIEKARARNLRAVYEVGSLDSYNSLKAFGIPANNLLYVQPKCGAGKNEPCITAPHFSMY